MLAERRSSDGAEWTVNIENYCGNTRIGAEIGSSEGVQKPPLRAPGRVKAAVCAPDDHSGELPASGTGYASLAEPDPRLVQGAEAFGTGSLAPGEGGDGHESRSVEGPR